jgi:hypothetical protein
MVDDNFHYQDSDERWEHGSFSTAAEALAACRRVIDESLLHEYSEGGVTAEKLYDRYGSFGDEPFVVAPQGAPKVDFSARSYARARAIELTAAVLGRPRRGVVRARKRWKHRLVFHLRSKP